MKGKLASTVALLFALAGAYVRVAHLGQQLIMADESHLVNVLSRDTFSRIVSTISDKDYCMPMAVTSWVLLRTIGLEEYGLRLLAFLPGVLLLVAVYKTGREWLSAPAFLSLVVLVSCSPLLTWWSRQARPYAMIALLGTLSLIVHVRLIRQVDWMMLAAAAMSQAGLLLFSLTTAPAVCGILAGTAVHGWRSRGGSRVRRTAMLAAPSLVGAAVAAAIAGPAVLSSTGNLGKKFGESGVPPDALPACARLLLGLPHGYGSGVLLLATIALLLVASFVAIHRKYGAAVPAFLGVFFSPLAYSIGGVRFLEDPQVLVRYQAAVVPAMLFLLVVGAEHLLEPLANRDRRRWAAIPWVVLVGLPGALAIRGPLLDGLPPANPFGHLATSLLSGSSREYLAGIAQAGNLGETFLMRANPEELAELRGRLGFTRVVRFSTSGGNEAPEGMVFRNLLLGRGEVLPRERSLVILDRYHRPPKGE